MVIRSSSRAMKVSLIFKADQTPPDLVTGKRPNYSADSAQNRTNNQRLITCCENAGAAKTAHENAGRERDSRCSLSCLRQQIANKFDNSQERKNDDGNY